MSSLDRVYCRENARLHSRFRARAFDWSASRSYVSWLISRRCDSTATLFVFAIHQFYLVLFCQYERFLGYDGVNFNFRFPEAGVLWKPSHLSVLLAKSLKRVLLSKFYFAMCSLTPSKGEPQHTHSQ